MRMSGSHHQRSMPFLALLKVCSQSLSLMMLWREVLRGSSRRTKRSSSRMQKLGPSNMQRSDQRWHAKGSKASQMKCHDVRTCISGRRVLWPLHVLAGFFRIQISYPMFSLLIFHVALRLPSKMETVASKIQSYWLREATINRAPHTASLLG